MLLSAFEVVTSSSCSDLGFFDNLDLLIDSQVIRGQHKGLMGQVVEATDSHVKVELHSKLKKVFISRNQASFPTEAEHGGLRLSLL